MKAKQHNELVNADVNKRKSFTALVSLLHKLGVTRFMNIPTVSNPYHLMDMKDLSKVLDSLGLKPPFL